MDDTAVDNLPTDIETLHSLLREARKEIHSLNTLVQIYREEKRLAAARQFSPSSEKEHLQLMLFNEAESTVEEHVNNTETNVVTTQIKAHQRRGGRNPLPDSLPRIEIIHDLSDEEKQCACGCTKEKIGEDIFEQLDIIPAIVQVLKHIRLKYVYKLCDSSPKTAMLPPQPIPKSQVSSGFLAYVITSKFADALPLYRQCHILKRSGIDYARNNLCRQVVSAGELVQPLINLMQEKVLEYPVLQMDETTV